MSDYSSTELQLREGLSSLSKECSDCVEAIDNGDFSPADHIDKVMDAFTVVLDPVDKILENLGESYDDERDEELQGVFKC